jgi:type IV pilus assembly protein PilN
VSNINLLPWREELRAKNNKNLLTASVTFWLACGLAGFLALQNMNGKLLYQDERNLYLKAEISKLKKKIADVNKLQEEKQKLIERIDVIQNLQQDRVHIVHVFDDIVRKLPAGVTLDRINKKQRVIQLKGRAQSNARVSELMNQVDSSKYFGRSNLNVVALQNSSGIDLREFDVVLTEALKDKEAAAGVQQ